MGGAWVEVPLSLPASFADEVLLYAEISFKYLWRLQWDKMGDHNLAGSRLSTQIGAEMSIS